MSKALVEANRRLAFVQRSVSLAAAELKEANERLDAKREEIMRSIVSVLPAYEDI